MSTRSRRTATIKYFRANPEGYLYHTRTEQIPVPLRAANHNNHGIGKQILDMLLYFMVFIGFLFALFAAWNGATTPTQFIMYIRNMTDIYNEEESIFYCVYRILCGTDSETTNKLWSE